LEGPQAVRVGFQANEQSDCDTPDSAIGVGLAGPVAAGFRGCDPHDACPPNNASTHPILSRFALVFVREE
jgi:hypothetical protein